MPTYFHDAASQTVYLAEDSRWSDRHGKPTSRAPRPELQGFDVHTTVISMSATSGFGDRQLQHLYPTPRYAREVARRMWDAHMRMQIPGTESPQKRLGEHTPWAASLEIADARAKAPRLRSGHATYPRFVRRGLSLRPWGTRTTPF
jgi:hypothetical protein